jgi:hypothetical protein
MARQTTRVWDSETGELLSGPPPLSATERDRLEMRRLRERAQRLRESGAWAIAGVEHTSNDGTVTRTERHYATREDFHRGKPTSTATTIITSGRAVACPSSARMAPRSRARGAGRPKGANRRASCRSGDSGSSDSDPSCSAAPTRTGVA